MHELRNPYIGRIAYGSRTADQPGAEPPRLLDKGGGGAVFHGELAINILQVMMHRAGTDAQNDADLRIPFALAHPAKNLAFPSRQQGQ